MQLLHVIPEKGLKPHGPSPCIAPDRVINLLQEILEEQSKLRRIVLENQQAIAPRLDDISASVSLLCAQQQQQQEISLKVEGALEQIEEEVVQAVKCPIETQNVTQNNKDEPISTTRTTSELIARKKQQQPHHRSLVARILLNTYFELGIALVILMNSVAMFISLQLRGLYEGWKLGFRDDEIDWAAHEDRLNMMEHFFNVVYVTELAMRIWVFGRRFPKSFANLLDSAIVLCGCFDIYIFPALKVEFINMSILRMMRLTRILRLGKVLRSSDFVSELRVLIRTLQAALNGVFWSVILLSGIIMVGGIIMAQLTINLLDNDSISFDRKKWMYQNFGTTLASTYTIFESTFTTSWIKYSRPLMEEVGYLFIAFWIPWVILVNFTTMRVVSALFLKETMAVSARDAENRAMMQLEQKSALAECLREIFKAADTSGDGAISQDEFDQMMASDDVMEIYAFMGLDTDEVTAFYTVLSADDGHADYNEFINGALAMASSAPNLDRMKSLQNQMKISRHVDGALNLLKKICQHLQLDTES